MGLYGLVGSGKLWIVGLWMLHFGRSWMWLFVVGIHWLAGWLEMGGLSGILEGWIYYYIDSVDT